MSINIEKYKKWLTAKLEKLQAKTKGEVVNSKEPSENQNDNNPKKAYRKQMMMFVVGVIGVLFVIVVFANFVSFKNNLGKQDTGSQEEPYAIDYEKADIELPDKAINSEQVWRGLHAEQRIEDKISLMKQIEELRKSQEAMLREMRNDLAVNLQNVNKTTEEKLSEMDRSKREIEEMIKQQQEIVSGNTNVMPVEIGETEFSNELVFSEPKPSSEYIPEGTFLSGNLLAGVVASTAMSAPDNPTPVVIKLTGRGDLDKRIWKKGKECRITASCYGEASSERVMVRLEKLTCKV
ncbi:MAG: hypothetical protein HRU35_05565, partial [Rickettsiaceae bacterium]|nr:hypothetical protein [Rickettsiaceae bacterium]